MAVVLVEHALHADSDRTLLTEILNWLVCMSGTVYEVSLWRGEHQHLLRGQPVLYSLQDGKNLLILDKLGWIRRSNLCVARRAQFLGRFLEKVSNAVLAEGMSAIGKDDWRAVLAVEFLFTALAGKDLIPHFVRYYKMKEACCCRLIDE